MLAAWAADAVLVLHGLFIVWVVAGGLAVLRWPGLAAAHLPAALWGVWIEWSGGICPLTPLENRLRVAAGQLGHEGSFIERYLTSAIYPDGLTRGMQFALGAVVLLLNAALYGLLIRRVLRQRRGRTD